MTKHKQFVFARSTSSIIFDWLGFISWSRLDPSDQNLVDQVTRDLGAARPIRQLRTSVHEIIED